MKIHLGDKIKELLFERKMSVSQFAAQIGVTPNSAYVMLKKELLHPKWVETISDVLGYNLFQHVYSPPAHSSHASTQSELISLREERDLLKQQNEEMKKELAFLKEINELLKKTAKK